MKVLLIAYEFPPIVAAQSLRWYYLGCELARLGVEMHVVCPDMPAAAPFPGDFPENLFIHRTWAGPFVGIPQTWLVKPGQAVSSSDVASGNSLLLKLYSLLRKGLNQLLYPDVRTEWYPFARRKIKQLMQEHEFDLLVSSHEPGVDLLLGLWARRRFNLPWLVDLADPLRTPYSPGWRSRLDLRVEARVLRAADRVLVTTENVVDLLCERHGEEARARFHVVSQGFSLRRQEISQVQERNDSLKLLFTGNFYQKFRNPENLAKAMMSLAHESIELSVVGDNTAFLDMFAGSNSKFFGKRDHFECLRLQQASDVLINLGNEQNYQLPGKVYEYLGSGRPILHIRMGRSDPAADLIERLGAGLVVRDDARAIESALRRLGGLFETGQLRTAFSVEKGLVEKYSWEKNAALCYRVMNEMLSSVEIELDPRE